MICDRIVVGIRDSSLVEKLQLDSELTLTKAVTLVRQAEAVKQQQPLLRGQNHPAESPARSEQLCIACQGSVHGKVAKGRSRGGTGAVRCRELA